MALIHREVSPSRPLPSLFKDDFFNSFFDWGTRNNSVTNTTIPSVNILEEHDQFVVELAAPGMEKKDFTIELDNEILTISSKLDQQDNLMEGSRYTRKEFSYQSFQRTFHLPKSVIDQGKVKAKYTNGLLLITIPKKEEAKALPPRKINIS